MNVLDASAQISGSRRATRSPHVGAVARLACAAALLLAVPSCSTQHEAQAAGMEAGARIPAADFDLEGSAALIRDGKVENGSDLERQLNRAERSRVDVDRDGKRDPIQVVEKRDATRRTLEVRAIPSSQRKQRAEDVAVPVALIVIEPSDAQARVTARYADTVIVTHPAPIVFVAPVVVGSFCYWSLVLDRPVFVGRYHIDVHVIRHEHVKYKKHKKHRKHRGRH
jgi:hypothetical protein